MDIKSGIYMIYNKVNQQVYIGQAVNIENRLKQHKGELKNNKHINKFLQNDYNEYGEEAFVFEPIYYCEEEFLNAMEKYFIDKYDSLNCGYNASDVKTFVRIETREKVRQKRLQKQFEELKEIFIDVSLECWITHKLNYHIAYLFDAYADEVCKLDDKLDVENDGLEETFLCDWYYKSCFKETIQYGEEMDKAVNTQVFKKYSDVIERGSKYFYNNFDYEVDLKTDNLICTVYWKSKRDNSNNGNKRLIVKLADKP